MLGQDPGDHGLVIAHLGNGSSATAVLNGKSVDTSMGLTPLEGLVMGTRSGDIDYGAASYIARVAGLDIAGINNMLNKESGLLGISELSSDCRDLEQAADRGHAGAKLALDVFVHRLVRYVGALATSLPRFDALVFTGGIGENSSRIRAATLRRLGVFGFRIDADANENIVGGRAGRIGFGHGPVALVVPTDEESMIARDAALLAGFAPFGQAHESAIAAE
jgi:acetate kinase